MLGHEDTQDRPSGLPCVLHTQLWSIVLAVSPRTPLVACSEARYSWHAGHRVTAQLADASPGVTTLGQGIQPLCGTGQAARLEPAVMV